MRARFAVLLLCLAVLSTGAYAQVTPQATPQVPPQTTPQVPAGPLTPGTLSPSEQSQRDTLIAPAEGKLKANDPATAYALLGPARSEFPNDFEVLRLSAQTALLSGQIEAARDLFERALATHPAQPWPLRLGLMETESRLGKWDDFDRDLAALRHAKTAGADPQLSKSNGFFIDQFQINNETIDVAIFPGMTSRYHTLFRFLLPRDTTSRAPTSAGVNTNDPADRCKDPNFQPYIDLESDDVDQAIFGKAHPDLAAKGGREFSLDTYPAPCSQGLIRFYDGEPKYETLRADVQKALDKATKPAK